MKKLDTRGRFPWKKFEEVTVLGRKMIFVPKVYVKNTTVDGHPAWYISNDLKDGYHLHPAFMNNGTETATGVLIGKYWTSGSFNDPQVDHVEIQSTDGKLPYLYVNHANAVACCKGLNLSVNGPDYQGWHLYNVYEHHLLARLMLIEYGTADLQYEMTENMSGRGISYYGICDFDGIAQNAPVTLSWVDGLYCPSVSDKLSIISATGTGSYVETEISGTDLCRSSKIVDFISGASEGRYDLSDLFIGKYVVDDSNGYMTDDTQNVYSGYSCLNNNNLEVSYGPLHLTSTVPTTLACFRLAKYV